MVDLSKNTPTGALAAAAGGLLAAALALLAAHVRPPDANFPGAPARLAYAAYDG